LWPRKSRDFLGHLDYVKTQKAEKPEIISIKMVKTRISLSIDKAVLEKLDRTINKVSIMSRSEAVEKIIDAHVSMEKTAVILAGGEPEKLFIKELNTFRPLVKVNGTPLLIDIIRKVRQAGYTSVIIIGAKEVLSAVYSTIGDGKELMVKVEYVEEKEHLGSGKSLSLAKPYIKNTFLLLPCDHYFEIELSDLEQYHQMNKKSATLVVYAGTEDEWNKTSIVRLEGNLIVDYIDKPKKADTHLTAIMIGLLEPSVFNTIPPGKISWSLQENVFSSLAKKKELVGYIFNGKWRNVHTKADVESLK
jgi:NDP-sugar pyrophosphorylase family protein